MFDSVFIWSRKLTNRESRDRPHLCACRALTMTPKVSNWMYFGKMSLTLSFDQASYGKSCRKDSLIQLPDSPHI